MRDFSDEELLVLMRSDVEFGVQAAIALYGGLVKKICSTILNGYARQDVEETVADCYVAFWKGIENFDLEKNCSLKSYLCGIAKNCALNRRRKLAKERQIEDGETVLRGMEDRRAGKEFESVLLKEVVDDLIEHMETTNREIFRRRYYQELSVSEIAGQLNLTVKAVENRLLRGKKTLRRQLIANDFSYSEGRENA